jgi:hypothetical protein
MKMQDGPPLRGRRGEKKRGVIVGVRRGSGMSTLFLDFKVANCASLLDSAKSL